MHWSVDFQDPVPDPPREPTLFEWVGGYPALLDMTRIFYSRYVPGDPPFWVRNGSDGSWSAGPILAFMLRNALKINECRPDTVT
jgi:hypothetical protein